MNTSPKQYVVIAGAGPAGLTAALELLRRTNYIPIILEKDSIAGGISRTVTYKGNRLDIGGHRFFSKSDRVLEWWNDILPFEDAALDSYLQYQGKETPVRIPKKQKKSDTKSGDKKMLLRKRLSRIYYNGDLFDYPVNLNYQTFKQLGFLKSCRIVATYCAAKINPIKPEVTLEDFFINRFGKELYLTFFKSYTEKVWGKSCTELSAEWGKQRVKGVSLFEIFRNFFAQKFTTQDYKKTKTSLIQQFLYPVHGPGQLWEEVAQEIIRLGGEIRYESIATNVHLENERVVAVSYKDKNNQTHRIFCEMFFSTMPVRELVAAIDTPVPDEIKKIASELEYRDFITVGLLLKNFDKEMKDNWIYMHDPSVSFARIQIFNNWSERMVSDPAHTWIGLEYIVNKNDSMWHKPDEMLAADSRADLEKIGFIKAEDCIDSHVVRIEKAYPVYAGSYAHFGKVREYVNTIPNLILIGRNGMHRYNNQDHSMLTALTAVDMITEGKMDHSKLWAINTDDEYQEEK